ncbi:nitrate- and nitrite sensing domain-containing protein [Actinomadura sp. DC4]|uniref:sensor histidine kinase n=1 Tax=Actinomadura sp. DC4 TaxID=3055069 RepID=UPI0025B256F9|nr:nitrate- and nitrite sensing domain-containing protein [Actinomadura sp. DC4]MDN3354424.1 nitrate- and nitrite sensing domain-containing protein [Actinomadura sp. DC4]
MRPRTRAIGTRIAALLLVPLLSLTALWAFAATITLNAALAKSDFSTTLSDVSTPVTGYVAMLQDERAAAAVALSTEDPAAQAKYQEQERKTDAAITAFRAQALSSHVKDTVGDETWERLNEADQSLYGLAELRSRVQSAAVTPLQSIQDYSAISDTTFRFLTNVGTSDEAPVFRRVTSLLYGYWARDIMLREDALMSSLPPRGRISVAGRAAFARWAGGREQISGLALAGLDGELRTIDQKLTDSPLYSRYERLENGIVTAGVNTPTGTDLSEWRTTKTLLSPLWLQNGEEAGALLAQQDKSAGTRILIRFYLAAGVGLLAVVASVVLSVLFGRGISGELRGLQEAAQTLAHERLPRVVARLRRGEDVDVDAEAAPPAAGRTKEVTLVADAFATVQRTAIETAVGEAELRGSINRVFTNLSWRSQSLLHRQLKLLDAMERRASSSEELEDLFRLDHLTTRMRRHAEGLVILSGSPTVRAWDHPVVLEDVVRAAIAEVEDYTRVDAAVSSSASILGAMVADVIHLLAELIENATVFSPPNTEVLVRADGVANGIAVEIVDRGIGLQPEQVEEINRRLTEPPEFDLADTDRLGLFVVARLAARHDIRVSVQPSAYGGVTAVVLLPNTLVAPEVTGPTPVPALPKPRVEVEAPPQAVRESVTGRLNAPGSPHTVPATVSGTVDEDAVAADAESSEVTGVLPRRRRQQHLAPQLRGSPTRTPKADADDFDEPSPELSRDLMASLQSGWSRGRDADEDLPDFDPWNKRGKQ